jgi:hypothetical protein
MNETPFGKRNADLIPATTRLRPGRIGRRDDWGANQGMIWIRLSIFYVARVLGKWVLFGTISNASAREAYRSAVL